MTSPLLQALLNEFCIEYNIDPTSYIRERYTEEDVYLLLKTFGEKIEKAYKGM